MKWIRNVSENKHVQNVSIIVLSVMAISLLVFHRYLFGGYYLLHSDLLRANLPTYYHMFDNIFLHEGAFWSWRMGIGTSMFSHGDSLFDPFVYIVFLRGREGIPSMMIWVLVVKLVFEAIAIYFYIDSFKMDRRAEILGAVLYAFSGYSLVCGNNFALGTVLVYLPLIFLGTEKWLRENKKGLLIFSLFLMGICNFYYFYISGILTFLYLTFRLIQFRRGKEWLRYTLELLGIGGISTLLSAPSILPMLELMLQSSRTTSGADIKMSWLLFMPNIKSTFTSIIRSFDLNILRGNDLGYLGVTYLAHDGLDNATFISAFFFILLSQWFYYDRKNRRSILWTTIVMLASVSLPVVSYVMNACSTINMRWLCIMPVLGAIVVAQGAHQVITHCGFHLKSLYVSVGVLGILYFVGIYVLSYASGTRFLSTIVDVIYGSWFYLLALLFVIGGFVLLASKQKRLSKRVIVPLMLMLMVFNIYVNHQFLYDNDHYCITYTEEAGACYMDSSAYVISDIQLQDQSFYRINKDFDSATCYVPVASCNDAMAQGYYGLKNYSSLNNCAYQDFLLESGIYPEGTNGQVLNYIYGLGERYDLMSYLGVKYYLTKDYNERRLSDRFKLYQTNGSITTYVNDRAYPLAFVNQEKMPLSQYKSLDKESKDLALLSYTIVDEDIPAIDITQMKTADIASLAKSKQQQFHLVNFGSDDVVFDIDVSEDNSILSLSMPYDKGWDIFIDGEKTDHLKVNVALLGAKINAGTHRVELKYIPRYFYMGIVCMCVALVMLAIIQKTKEK